jgi:hypothetical protein
LGSLRVLYGYGNDFKNIATTYAKSKQIMQVIYFE